MILLICLLNVQTQKGRMVNMIVVAIIATTVGIGTYCCCKVAGNYERKMEALTYDNSIRR